MIIYLRAIVAILCWLPLALSVKICHLIRTELVCRWTIGLAHHFHLNFTVSEILNSRDTSCSDGFSFDRRMFSEISWVISYQFLLIKLIDSLVLIVLASLNLLVIINQNRLSELVMLLLSYRIISSGVVIISDLTICLEVLSYLKTIFRRFSLLEAKVLRCKRNISHWLSWLLLFGSRLHLPLRLISCILYRYRISICHLTPVLRWVIIAHLGRLRCWLTLNDTVLVVVGVHHFVIYSRHLEVLVCVMNILLVLLDLLLLHRKAQRVALLSVDRRILASISLCFTYWIDLSHLNHWSLHLNWLLFRLAFILILLSLICALLWALILNIIYRSLRILSLQWSIHRWMVYLLWISRSRDGATHSHVMVGADGSTHLVADRLHVVTSCEEHWVDVVEMHLLELWVLHVI